jgi:tRNA1(Val) A37 N6-methylase TrmN6
MAATTDRPDTKDAFHRGNFWLVQPAAKGHRAGMDAMMLAAAVPSRFSGRLADLGAGAGAAGLAVASRCPAAHVVLVEREREMTTFAERTLALGENRHLCDRITVLAADVGLAGKAREAAGLTNASFDFAVMNPPFNAPHDRATPDALKRQAHVMEDGLLERWIRTAAAIVRPRGSLALIARPASLPAIFGALKGRFGNATIKAVHPHPDTLAIRVVVRAVRGTRGAPSLAPPLALHDANGDRFCAHAEAINNGRASLFGD